MSYEAEIVTLFTDFLADFIDSTQLRELLKYAECDFREHELELFQKALHGVTIATNNKVEPVWLDSDDLTGICRYCGEEWRGVEDESVVNIYDYESFLNVEEGDSFHASCLRENQCISCGAYEGIKVVDGIGRLCWLCEKSMSHVATEIG